MNRTKVKFYINYVAIVVKLFEGKMHLNWFLKLY